MEAEERSTEKKPRKLALILVPKRPGEGKAGKLVRGQMGW